MNLDKRGFPEKAASTGDPRSELLDFWVLPRSGLLLLFRGLCPVGKQRPREPGCIYPPGGGRGRGLCTCKMLGSCYLETQDTGFTLSRDLLRGT